VHRGQPIAKLEVRVTEQTIDCCVKHGRLEAATTEFERGGGFDPSSAIRVKPFENVTFSSAVETLKM